MVLNAFKCSVTELPSLILRRYNFFLRNNLFTRDFDWYKLPTCPTISWMNLHLRHSTVPNLQDKVESYSLLFSRVSPILPSTYLSAWYLDRCCPLFLIYKEIFNFKLPKLKILAIEFFDLYSRAARHSLTQSLKISNL
jgi:hypothetical protein